MNRIPFFSHGHEGPVLHFAHANGYPPGAYRPLLEKLATNCRVLAMHMRPLWSPHSPESFQDWTPLSEDLAAFLDQRGLRQVIGAGHSMGATATLRLALEQPERFSALALIDPVFFPPWFIHAGRLTSRIGLLEQIHPLIKKTLRRRTDFESKEAMFENYRRKPVFQGISDSGLMAYVDSMATPLDNGTVRLSYPPAWEAQVYRTGARGDMDIWRRLGHLQPPLLVIRGENSDTFWASTGQRMLRLLPGAQVITIPNTTHLVPLEAPEQVHKLIYDFITPVSADL